MGKGIQLGLDNLALKEKKVMGVPDAVGDMIRRYGSAAEAARACNMPERTMANLKFGGNPTLDNLCKIARGLDMSLAEFAATYGLGDETPTASVNKKQTA